jgi:hypothetical protein
MSNALVLQHLDGEDLATLERPAPPSKRHPLSLQIRSLVTRPLIPSVIAFQLLTWIAYVAGIGLLESVLSGVWIGLAAMGLAAIVASAVLNQRHKRSLVGSFEYEYYLAAKELTSTRTLPQYQVAVSGDGAETVVSLMMVDRTQSPTARTIIDSKSFRGGDIEALEAVVEYRSSLEYRAGELNGQARKVYLDNQTQIHAAHEMRRLLAG